MGTKQSKFNQWVDDFGGVAKLAIELDVLQHTVRVWLRGEGAPNSEKIMKIIKLSKGELSFQDIFKDSTSNKKAGAK